MDSHPHGPPILQPPPSWSEPCTLARIEGGPLCQTSSQSHWCCCCENPHRGHLGHHFSASKIEREATSLPDTSSTEIRFTQQPGPSMDPVVLPASCWLVGGLVGLTQCCSCVHVSGGTGWSRAAAHAQLRPSSPPSSPAMPCARVV